MRLKYNIIAIALLGVGFSSCNDFLNQNPQTDLIRQYTQPIIRVGNQSG